MRVLRIVAVMAFVIFLLEVGLWEEASQSKRKALQMVQELDRYRLGSTSRAEVESGLRHLDLVLQDEACSASSGSCEGIGVVLANYPQSSNRIIAPVLDFIAARVSVFRPTYLIASLYFYSDRLGMVTVDFSTDKASIGTMLDSADPGQNATSEWRRSNRTGNETFVRVLDPVHQQGTSLSAAHFFDLGCMESIRGCNTALELWPSVPRYKANQ